MQKNNLKTILIILAVFFQFFMIIFSVARNEYQLKNGTEIILKLRPVDPRSLIQGDYVTLNYDISEPEGFDFDRHDRGSFKIILRKGANNVYYYDYATQKQKEFGADQIAINAKLKAGRLMYGIENFFIEEDTGRKVEGSAVYALVNVSSSGNALVVNLMSDTNTKIFKDE